MNFIENYLKIVKESDVIIRECEKNNIVDAQEIKIAKTIYQNAFKGLIGNGYPHNTSKGNLCIEIGLTKYSCPSNEMHDAEKENDSSLEEYEEENENSITEEITTIQSSDEVEESKPTLNEPEGLSEEEIETSFENEESISNEAFDANKTNIEEPNRDYSSYESDSFEMEPEDFEPDPGEPNLDEPSDVSNEDIEPELASEMEEKLDLESEESEENVTEQKNEKETLDGKNEEQKGTEESTEQGVAVGDVQDRRKNEMPDKMQKDDFTFNFDKIRVSNADKTVKEDVRLLVAPMSINEYNPDILVCAIINHESHVTISRNKVARIVVAGYTVEIKGYMDGGVFVTRYVLSADAEDDNMIIQTKSKHHGSCGHILLEGAGTSIHVLPAGFSNNGRGVADFIYYINTNGEEKMGDTSDGKPITFEIENKVYSLIARWKDETLYCYVTEFE